QDVDAPEDGRRNDGRVGDLIAAEGQATTVDQGQGALRAQAAHRNDRVAPGTVVAEVVEVQVDLRVLVDQVLDRGSADLPEFLCGNLGDRAGSRERLALDARTGHGDRVQTGGRLGFFGCLGQGSAAAREGDRGHRQRQRDRVPQLVSLQSHLSLQRENGCFPWEPPRWNQGRRQPGKVAPDTTRLWREIKVLLTIRLQSVIAGELARIRGLGPYRSCS